MYRKQRRRHVARGQALVIFALSLTAVIALAGISIDGLRVYIAFGQGQRAAEAAALAGVVYLPAYATAATRAPDGNDARDRALQEAAKNGFTDASAITVTAAVGPPATLAVRIHFSVGLTLVALLNPTPVSGDAVATAEMLAPIMLGDTSGAFGDAARYGHFAAIVGPNDLKELGDPYSVRCEDGWSQASDTSHADAASNSYTTRLGTNTNAPQYPTGSTCSPGAPGNPDKIPAGFGGLTTGGGAATTGDNFLITLPPSNANYSVWVWNPRFAYGDADQHSRFYTDENVMQAETLDNPILYPQIAYSLYAAPELYDRATDIPLAAIWPSTTATPDTSPNLPLPATQITRDPAVDASYNNSCGEDKNWTVDGTCITQPADIDNWMQIPSGTLMAASSNAATNYRLTVSSTIGADIGYGMHDYAVRVCQNPAAATNCNATGATIAAWNSATMSLHSPSLSTTYPLANIPATYAGRGVSLALYNPGVGQGDVTLRIIPPAGGGTVSYPAYLRLANNSGTTAIQTAVAGDNLYHGKWVDLTLTLPPDYAGGEWQLQWTSDTAGPDTLMTLAASLLGRPISLIP